MNIISVISTSNNFHGKLYLLRPCFKKYVFYVFCIVNQMTGFYMECNTGLKLVKAFTKYRKHQLAPKGTEFWHVSNIYLIAKYTRWHHNRRSVYFLSGFSFTDASESRDSRVRERIIFILLYHFHPLTNIRIFIYLFACEMTITRPPKINSTHLAIRAYVPIGYTEKLGA